MKYTEVQSQEMALTQSPSLSKNPKVLTYNLSLYVVINNMPAIILCVTAKYNTCNWNWSTNKEIDDDDDGNYRIQLGAT